MNTPSLQSGSILDLASPRRGQQAPSNDRNRDASAFGALLQKQGGKGKAPDRTAGPLARNDIAASRQDAKDVGRSSGPWGEATPGKAEPPPFTLSSFFSTRRSAEVEFAPAALNGPHKGPASVEPVVDDAESLPVEDAKGLPVEDVEALPVEADADGNEDEPATPATDMVVSPDGEERPAGTAGASSGIAETVRSVEVPAGKNRQPDTASDRPSSVDGRAPKEAMPASSVPSGEGRAIDRATIAPPASAVAAAATQAAGDRPKSPGGGEEKRVPRNADRAEPAAARANAGPGALTRPDAAPAPSPERNVSNSVLRTSDGVDDTGRQPSASRASQPEADGGTSSPKPAVTIVDRPAPGLTPMPQLSTTASSLVADLAPRLEASAAAGPAAMPNETAATRAPDSLRIQLNPAHLGTVTARLSIEGGQLTVEITVESDAALRQLTTDRETIERSLRGLGLDLGEVRISQAQPSAGGQQANTGAGQRDGQPQQQFAQQEGTGGSGGERRQNGQENGFGQARGDNAVANGQVGAGGHGARNGHFI
ncbi:MAG: flagellar hook-length control protein FliK [Rhizobiaceae bacterium]|nr:flagellar hook-length control protein FliK [Rhizobiaceae bacterium]MCV0407008.1 flagellar hook-length control protein FliK [Rhizobiaceae bacterium]